MKSYQKIIRISNYYYNEGLERAQVHNLSGAIESLETSLHYYKGNIDARNLLGLVYYEIGEWVQALREWVISLNLQPEDNLAKEYVDNIKSEMSRSGKLNQCIKKFNQSLMYANNDSEDLAVIQLKKIISVCPNFLKAHQLLALIYIHNEQYIQAKDVLRKAGRIDANNTTTLRYLKEVNTYLREEKDKKSGKKKHVAEDTISYRSGNETIIRPTYFRDNSTFASIGNIVFGLIVGFLITFFLVVPGIKQDMAAENAQKLVEANNTISSKNNAITQYVKEIDSLKQQLQDAQNANSDSTINANFYKSFLDAYVSYHQGDYLSAGDVINQIADEKVAEEYRELFDGVKNLINEQYIGELYTKAEGLYNQHSYEEAVSCYEKIVRINERYNDGMALYNLGHAYRMSGEMQSAAECFRKVIEYYPGTDLAANAQANLDLLEN